MRAETLMEPTDLTFAQKSWALAAATIFIASIGWLGIALSTQTMMIFAVGWPLIQVIGYTGSLKRAAGDTAHPLFVTQVVLNLTVVGLIIALLLGAV